MPASRKRSARKTPAGKTPANRALAKKASAKKPAGAPAGRNAAPWDKPPPDDGKPAKHLTSGEKGEARARARKAGRPYPNLVDNMAVARRKPDPGGKPQPGRH